ncbi:MAG: hypothetical protein AAFR93_00315 [Pseudomonadota bacterium]
MSRYKKAIPMVVASLVLAPVALAQSEVSGALSQNLDIQSNDGDTSIEANTGLSVDLRSETATSSSVLSTGAALSIDDDGEVEITRPTLSFSLGQQEKRTRYSLSGSFQRRPTTFFEEEIGELTPLEALLGIDPDVNINQFDTERTSYGLRASISTDLTSRLGATFGLSGDVVDFEQTSSELVPSTTLGMNSSLNYDVTDSLRVSANASLRFVDTDTATDISNRILDVGGSFTRTINANETLTGGLGITTNEREEVFSTGTVTETESDLTFNLGYSRALPDGTLTFGFTQGSATDSAGETVTSSQVSAALERQINQNTSFGLSTGFSRQTAIGGGDESTLFRVNPTLSWQLTRLVSANAGYTFQVDDDGDNDHRLLLGLSRSFGGPVR